MHAVFYHVYITCYHVHFFQSITYCRIQGEVYRIWSLCCRITYNMYPVICQTFFSHILPQWWLFCLDILVSFVFFGTSIWQYLKISLEYGNNMFHLGLLLCLLIFVMSCHFPSIILCTSSFSHIYHFSLPWFKNILFVIFV